MSDQVTFGADAANALLRAKSPVLNCYGEALVSQVAGNFGPYHLPEGTTLASEQVTAAVQADPGKLAARLTDGGGTYAWFGDRWRMWSIVVHRFINLHEASPDSGRGWWELVYRPDLKHAPEEPTCPAQGTTLRAIMEWCFHTNTAVDAKREAISDRDVSVDCVGDLETSFWLSEMDVYEADDWQASTDCGKTWFVPGKVEPREESGPKETVSPDFMHEAALPRTTRVLSEAVAHVEAGGVMDDGSELFRIRDGLWEYLAAGESSWSRGDGKWVVSTGEEYTLYPADYLDDAPKVEPREGPELWAWMCSRTMCTVINSMGSLWRITDDGRVEMCLVNSSQWSRADLPTCPCTPAIGRWGDES